MKISRVTTLAPSFFVLSALAPLCGTPPTARGQVFVSEYYGSRVGEYTTYGAAINAALVPSAFTPWGVAISGSNLFVTNSYSGTVGEYDARTGATINASLISGLFNPQAIAVSGSDLYVTAGGAVGKYKTEGTPVSTSLIPGLHGPNGIAVSGGDLFITNQSTGVVGEYTTSGAVVNASLITGASAPIAVSGSDIFVVHFFGNDVVIGEYTTAGVVVNPSLISGFNFPQGDDGILGIAVCGSDLFVTNILAGTIGEYTTSGAAVDASLISSLNHPSGIVAVMTDFVWTGTTNNNWDTVATDLNWATSSAWSNNPNRVIPNNATFNLATPATVTVNGNIDVSAITFTTGGWSLNPGSGVLAFGATGAINIMAATGSDVVIAAIVDGSTFGSGGAVTSVIKSGDGTLILGGFNSYSGSTTITGGTLVIAGGALPSGSVVANAGTLVVNGNSVAGAITGNGATVVAGHVTLTVPSVVQGSLTINGTVVLAGTALGSGPGNRNPGATTSVLGGLVIAGGVVPTGKLNLNNNVVVVSGGGAAGRDMAEAEIGYARDGGAWDRAGITSSVAQAAHVATGFDSLTIGVVLNSDLATPYTSFGGVAVNPSDVLMMLTYGGDANLNGVVNGDDYFQIDQGFVNHLTGWINGDFNHDGVVNGDDYFIIDSNFINQSGQLAAGEVLAHEAEFGPSYLSGFTSAQLTAIGVPEPGTLGLAVLAAAPLLVRRRRGRMREKRCIRGAEFFGKGI